MENPKLGISELCELFGVSKQAYYQGNKSDFSDIVAEEVVVEMVLDIRKRCPGVGTRKLQKMLEKFYGLNYGRDRLFSLLEKHSLLLRVRHRSPRTTFSGHLFPVYPNIVKDLIPTRPNEVWVSDITYIKVEGSFLYLFLVTDMYSRKIVGWSLADNMMAKNAVKALRMAISQKFDPMLPTIHHSDKGTQYCCADYIKVLKHHNINISMTDAADPRENAYAERVNGIIKNEFLRHLRPIRANAHAVVKIAIYNYNTFRIHSSINWLTPEEAHYTRGVLERMWKKYPWYHKDKSQENANFADIPPKGETTVKRCEPETIGASSPDSFNPPSRLHEPIPV